MSGQFHPETLDRRRTMLRTAMGKHIAEALADPVVIEVMVNPDGRLRLDCLGEGVIDTGVRLGKADIERIIRLVAEHRAEPKPGTMTTMLLAEMAERPSEIDLDRAEQAKRRAEERLAAAQNDPNVDWGRAAVALQRSLIRIQVARRQRSAAVSSQ